MLATGDSQLLGRRKKKLYHDANMPTSRLPDSSASAAWLRESRYRGRAECPTALQLVHSRNGQSYTASPAGSL